MVHEEITKFLEVGVITPSTSEYCSSVVLVTKKDERVRFCVDYREINKLIIMEEPNLPPIMKMVRELGKAIFTILDLRNGFWQAPLSRSSRKYTAFGAPYGTIYKFRFLRIGLKNCPVAFQKLMASLLAFNKMKELVAQPLE
ncbi:hypothetical protein JTB14_028967 [Gonioctena quinquepunctata]|nr:hypothetical protein JTB14_028967 [Gonioctena quinquepunctata]